jgi:putative DNA primase/helicase
MAKTPNQKPTLETIKAALTYLPSHERELWTKVGMALKAELGDSGFDVFDTWSQNAENYDAGAAKSVWKGFKAGGKVTIGTLLYEAQQRGFDIKSHKPAPPVSAEETERLQRERQQRDAEELAEAERLQALVVKKAANAWSKAVTNGESPYLAKKKIAAHGIGFAKAGAADKVLIPVRDQDGKLWNLQHIFADGNKVFYKGGKVVGCFHVIGDVAASEWLLIAEGYATAATLHEATGFAVVIAFSAHNLKHVAGIMRGRYPQKQILLCADNDSETERTKGKNTGVIAATEAAQLVGGQWCKPTGFQYGGNDFNDLMHSSGIDEVKRQIDAAIQTTKTTKAEATTPPIATIAPTLSIANAPTVNQTEPSGDKSDTVKTDKDAPQKTPQKSRESKTRKPVGDGQSSKPFFTENEEGVFYHAFHEGEPLPALKLCSPLRVLAETRDVTASEWGYLLEFSDPDGNVKRWTMPSRMLSGDGNQYRAELLSMGLKIEPGVKVKNYLTNYVQTSKVLDRVRCVDRIGWHDNVYVLPDRTIGETAEKVLFQSAGGMASHFKQRGELADWQTNIGVYCRGNSRLLFAVSLGFASTLLHHAKIESFGFHMVGSSSIGKSTIMKVAASLFGGTNYAQSWHATGNGLETIAQRYSDAMLLLDELGQAEANMVGKIIYMLGNQKGKLRSSQHATAKIVATWRTTFLSDGELSIEAKMAEAGNPIKAGQEVRMAHINADAGKGLGVFDTVHGFADGAALSRHLVTMAGQYYGTPIITFIEWLTTNAEDLSLALTQAIKATTDKLCPANASGQVKRVAEFCAIDAVAGEWATAAGVTGWADGEATEAAKQIFNEWLSYRGGEGDIEQDRMLRLLPDFIAINGNARFEWEHRAFDDHAPKVIKQAGYKRMISKSGTPIKTNTDYQKEYGDKMHPEEVEGSGTDYFIIPKVFTEEICKGYDARTVAAKLIEAGVLEPDKNGKASAAVYVAGGTKRYYKVSSQKLNEL